MKTRLLDEFRIGLTRVPFDFKGESREVWIRRPNTPEKQMCEQYARIASRELRKVLEDPKTEEHKVLVQQEIALQPREELELMWIAGQFFQRAFEFERQTLEDRDQTFIPEPETEDGVHYPSQADLDHYETTVQETEDQREEAVQQAQANIANQLRDEAKQIPIKELRKGAVPRRIEQLTGLAYNEEFSVHLLARCTFEDELGKRPMFKTTDEVRGFFRDYPEIAQVIAIGHQTLMDNPEEVKA